MAPLVFKFPIIMALAVLAAESKNGDDGKASMWIGKVD
jgi:hypothetical protein